VHHLNSTHFAILLYASEIGRMPKLTAIQLSWSSTLSPSSKKHFLRSKFKT